jgi:hypothetical protein
MKRMRLFLSATLISMICSLDFAHATKIEIPLPQVSGAYITTYNSTVSRQTTFRFDRLPIDIYGVSIKLKGKSFPGVWWCDYTQPITLARRIVFVATMSDSVTAGVWRAERMIGNWDQESPFEFEVEIAFLPQSSASWDFLRAGRGTLVLKGLPETVPGGFDCISYYPAATVYLATLVVDADYQIGTEQSTWGSIKALFSR